MPTRPCALWPECSPPAADLGGILRGLCDAVWLHLVDTEPMDACNARRWFALPGLQATRSPLVSTASLAVLITDWHLPLFFLEGGDLPLSTFVGGIVGPAGQLST
jgi:hypothetical protein